MPRKNLAVVRTTVVALTLAVLLGLVGQVAQALPLTPRPALAAPSTVDSIASLWSWITGRLAAALLPSPAATAVSFHPKNGVTSDPAGGALAQGTFVPGTAIPLP